MSEYMIEITDKKINSWNKCMGEDLSIGNTYEMSKYSSFIRIMPLFIRVFMGNECVACWILYKRRFEKNNQLRAYTFPDVKGNYKEIFGSIIYELKNRFAGYTLLIDSYTFARNKDISLLQELGFECIKAYTAYVSKITLNDDEIISSFHKSHKQDTRKAIKEKYEYRADISSREYYKLSKETYLRSDKKSSVSYRNVKRWKKIYKESGILSGVYVDGKLQAASMIPFHGKEAVYYHGASSNSKARGVTAFLQYCNILYLRDRGIEWYDFTGTSVIYGDAGFCYTDEKAESLDRFKQRFGGEQQIHFSGEYKL